RLIRGGDHWFGAWMGQMATPYVKLAQRTGLSIGRITAIDRGDAISRCELEALALAWSVSVGDLERSIGGKTQIVE
ncbi:MAG: hypothetical protein ACTHKR_09085, partial [Sphingomonas sp.]